MIDLPAIQHKTNLHFSLTLDLFGSEESTNAANFCEFTNEICASIQDATAHSGQRYPTAIDGTAAGGRARRVASYSGRQGVHREPHAA